MSFYISIFAGLSFFVILEQLTNICRVYVKSIYFLFMFFFFCLSFLRWQNGTDWFAYYNLFVYSFFEDHYEWGYLLLVHSIRMLTNDYTCFLFVEGFIYFILFWIFSKKTNNVLCREKDDSFFFLILLYFFCIGLSGIFFVRSHIAYMLGLVALFDVFHKKKVQFIIKILLASTIHSSSVFFLFFYPFFFMGHLKIKKAIVIIISCILVSFSCQYIDFFSIIGLSKYSTYLKQGVSFGIGVLRWFILFLVLFFFQNQVKTNLSKEKVLLYEGCFNIYFIGFLLYFFSVLVAPVFLRFTGVYLDSSIICLSLISQTLTSGKKILFVLGLIIFGFVSLFGNLNGQYQDLLIPFHFFWEYK